MRSNETFDRGIEAALSQYCAAARAEELPFEDLVAGLRAAHDAAILERQTSIAIAKRYRRALVRLMALYFGDDLQSSPVGTDGR